MSDLAYKWVPGCRMGGNAQAVGLELEALRKKHGALTAEIVVRAARAASSVLHRYFTWDDAKAGHERRLDQARGLIRFVAVSVERENDEPLTVRSFVKAEVGYGSTIRVMSQANSRAELLRLALEELECFKQKYARLVELGDIFEAAERLRKKLSKRAAA